MGQSVKGWRYLLNYLKFWLKYIYPYKEEIESPLEQHIDSVIKDYPNYLGKIFEDFCTKFIRDSKRFEFNKIGTWWYKDDEIDIVRINEKNKEIIFGECKWRDKVNAEKIISELSEKTEYVKWNNETRKETYAVFVKSFSKKINGFKGKKVYCFDLKDLEKKLKR